MKLLLVSKTAIVIKIFTLVCEKLGISLESQEHNNIEQKYDLIVLDEEYIDDSFNSKKQYCKKIGAINFEDLPFDKSRDFIIPRPFLPFKLQSILQEVVRSIEEDKRMSDLEKQKETVLNEERYMGSLANFIAKDLEDENDESIVSIESLKDSGAFNRKNLDNKKALDNIKNLLNIEVVENEVEMNEDDWQDLDQLLDEELENVKDYEVDLNSVDKIQLILNKFSMEELKPLLLKLDQNSIDKLVNGNLINLEIKLKEN